MSSDTSVSISCTKNTTNRRRQDDSLFPFHFYELSPNNRSIAAHKKEMGAIIQPHKK